MVERNSMARERATCSCYRSKRSNEVVTGKDRPASQARALHHGARGRGVCRAGDAKAVRAVCSSAWINPARSDARCHSSPVVRFRVRSGTRSLRRDRPAGGL
jgi:hypothetical protein